MTPVERFTALRTLIASVIAVATYAGLMARASIYGPNKALVMCMSAVGLVALLWVIIKAFIQAHENDIYRVKLFMRGEKF